MDWTTLFSVIIGGLIATVPILISNRHQAQERDKDRLEQRKGAGKQLRLELMKHDMDILEEKIDNSLKALEYIEHSRRTKDFSVDQVYEELAAGTGVVSGLMSNTELVAAKIANSISDEIYSRLLRFNSLSVDYAFKCLRWKEDNISDDDLRRLSHRIVEEAGSIHVMLMEKLLTIQYE